MGDDLTMPNVPTFVVPLPDGDFLQVQAVQQDDVQVSVTGPHGELRSTSALDQETCVVVAEAFSVIAKLVD
jgi:hypothetical protein